MTDNELKDECMENAEIDLGRYSYKELTQIREAMRMYADRKLKLFAIHDVSGSLLSEIVKDLGGTNRKFLLWHDGGEWTLSLNGDEKQSKTLSELVCRNDG